MAFVPTLEDVGALIRARTKDNTGVELGTFTDQTRPTDVEVNTLIAQAVAEVSSRCGDVPVPLEDAARRAAALRTGQLIERSYYPEQSTESQPAFLSLRWQWEDAILRLIQDCQFRALSVAEDEVQAPEVLGVFTATSANSESGNIDLGYGGHILAPLTVQMTSFDGGGDTLSITVKGSYDGVTFFNVSLSTPLDFTSSVTKDTTAVVPRYIRIAWAWTPTPGVSATFAVTATTE